MWGRDHEDVGDSTDRRNTNSAMEDVIVTDVIDPHELNRFLHAQESDYERALYELRRGEKRTHWMWYIFPQFDGLAWSSISKRYAIRTVAEAKAYIAHPILGSRLIECCEAVVGVKGKSVAEIFGTPDDMKLRSCVTLFAAVSPAGSVFDEVLQKYFVATRDAKTLQLMDTAAAAK